MTEGRFNQSYELKKRSSVKEGRGIITIKVYDDKSHVANVPSGAKGVVGGGDKKLIMMTKSM